MTPEKKLAIFWGRAAMYIIFAIAYVSAVTLFGMLYENIWAATGFGLTICLILVRLWQHMVPPEKFYMMFPVASWQRALWQACFFAAFLAGLALSIYLFARGLQKRQNWSPDSYFCGMTGVAMATKWAMFVCLSLKGARLDNMDEETLDKVHMLMAIEKGIPYHSTLSFNSEPATPQRKQTAEDEV